eukprot:TRINITY_DN15354_c0_g1_i2.p1 TRINITY_DN15354_c0_g1~~TRINITY_DN15354_c0_g1_i2.p1  ORF type:complete len:1119 (-),score=273.74 TRINITY_DN15354_c0_g1_i2:219-3182(-)
MGSLSFKKLQESFKPAKALRSTECTRDGLIEYMIEEYETITALWSLPQTIVLFIVFVICVHSHLRVDIAYTMQDSLEGGVTGEGAPFLHKYVHDIPSMWDWMESSFLGVTFKQDLHNFPYPGRLESYNQIIGGVQLVKTDVHPGKCEQHETLQKFYDTLFGNCDTNAEPYSESKFLMYHETHEQMLEYFKEWRDGLWLSLNTSMVDHTILFYNAYLGTYTDYHLTMSFQWDAGSNGFQKDGVMYMRFNQESFLAEAYYSMWIVVCDFIFTFIVLRMMFAELGEIVPASLNGLDGFVNYWDIWNVVDWSSMLLSVTVIVMWGVVCIKVNGDLVASIEQLPSRQLDFEIFVNKTYLSRDELNRIVDRQQMEEQIAAVHTISGEIANLHGWLRNVIFFNALLMMMKFFKAFRANPRLNVVIMTLSSSAIDFFHFMIVFILIMLVYALMGYSWFGTFVVEFSTLPKACMICWRILMGEDLSDDMSIFGMGLAAFWIISYQFFVGLILLNITVAIIMDAYTAVNSGGEKLTIWTQVAEAIRTKKETRGFIDLWYLICEFKDDDEPAHPGSKVTSRSLRRAFERKRMSKANAEYLVRKTQEYMEQKEEEQELSLTDALRVIGQVRTHSMKTSVNCETILEMLKAQARAPQEARFDAIIAGVDPDAMSHPTGNPQGYPGGGMGGMPGGMSNGFAGAGKSNGFSHSNGFSNGYGAGGGPNSTIASSNGFGAPLQPITDGSVNHFPPPPVGGSMETSLVPSSPGSPSPSSAAGVVATIPQRGAPTTVMGNDPGAAAMMGNQMAPMIMQMMTQNNQIMMTMQHLASQMEVLKTSIKDNEEAALKRHEVMEQRMFALDRRNERVEKACDQLRNTMQGVDFDELMRMPTRVAENVATRVSQVLPGGGGEGRQSMVVATRSGATDNGGNGNNGPASRRVLEDRVEKMAAEVKEVLALAQEASESRKMLWRIDLQLKQMKAPSPSQTLPGNGARSSNFGGM